MNIVEIVKAGELALEQLPKLLTLGRAVAQLVAGDPELGMRLDAALAQAEATNLSRSAAEKLEAELEALGPLTGRGG